MSKLFNPGDRVRVKNGVKVNGVPMEELIGEVEIMRDDFVFLKYSNFKYTAHKDCCRKVR